MNRRGFLGSILALGAAPAIVRADSLMRIVATDTTILLPFPMGAILVKAAGGWERASGLYAPDHDKIGVWDGKRVQTRSIYQVMTYIQQSAK